MALLFNQLRWPSFEILMDKEKKISYLKFRGLAALILVIHFQLLVVPFIQTQTWLELDSFWCSASLFSCTNAISFIFCHTILESFQQTYPICFGWEHCLKSPFPLMNCLFLLHSMRLNSSELSLLVLQNFFQI